MVFPFVLSEKFDQDVEEEYFGRSLDRRNDSPKIYGFGFNANTICSP